MNEGIRARADVVPSRSINDFRRRGQSIASGCRDLPQIRCDRAHGPHAGAASESADEGLLIAAARRREPGGLPCNRIGRGHATNAVLQPATTGLAVSSPDPTVESARGLKHEIKQPTNPE